MQTSDIDTSITSGPTFLIESDVDVFSLLLSLTKAFPILSAVEPDLDSIKDQQSANKIRKIVQLHTAIVTDIRTEFGLDMRSINDRIKYRHITESISRLLYRNRDKLDLDETELNVFRQRVVDTVKSISKASRGDSIGLVEASLDNKIIAMKMSLLSGSVKINELLKTLLFDAESDVLRHFNKTIPEIAKDLAVNWSKRSNITDQEALFEQVIPLCSDIYIAALREEILVPISEFMPKSEASFWKDYPQFRSILEELDMGYADDKGQVDELKDRVLDDLVKRVEMLTDLNVGFTGYQVGKIRSAIIHAVSGLSMDAWQEAAESHMAKFEGLTEEAYDRLIEEIGDDPMEFSIYTEILSEKIDYWDGLFSEGAIDLLNVEKKTKKELVKLWGLSDAIFKTKQY